MPIESNCPGCGAKVRIPESMLGKRVRCPKCEMIFTAEAPDAGYEEVAEEDPRPVRRRPAPVEDDDRHDDDDYEPQPRRGGGRRAAQSAVTGPAIALGIAGLIGLAFAVLNLLFVIAGKGQIVDLRKQQMVAQQQDQFPGMIITVSVVPIIWGIIVPYGAFKMMRLENYSSVMIGVVFAMLPCNGFCLFGLPFAIWALVVLNRPEVKRAFSS